MPFDLAALPGLLALALALSVDAAVLTAAHAGVLGRGRGLFWAGLVGILHGAFPLLGVLLVRRYGSGAGVAPYVYAVALLLLLALLASAWRERSRTGTAPDPGLGGGRGVARLVLAAFAVSLDAFVVGPGLVGLVEGWSAGALLAAGALLGALVCGLTLLALVSSRRLLEGPFQRYARGLELAVLFALSVLTAIRLVRAMG